MTFVDSNVLIDILSSNPIWLGWSTQQLAIRSGLGALIIDDVIYAEIATYAPSASALDDDLRDLDVELRRIPRLALFAAAKAFHRYRSRGGSRPQCPTRLLHRCARSGGRLSAVDPRCRTISRLFSGCSADRAGPVIVRTSCT